MRWNGTKKARSRNRLLADVMVLVGLEPTTPSLSS